MTLKEFRRSLKLTQQQLADKLSVHKTTVQAWESGKQVPKDESLEKLEELGYVFPVRVTARKPAEQPYIPPKRPKIRIDAWPYRRK